MIKTEGLHIDLFEETAKKFADHLLVRDNERIIFSGRFGTGKTTFLQEFFREGNQKNSFSNNKAFNIIRLFPVNYSVASNEDIFRYIKYDIIIEMLKNGYDIEDYILDSMDVMPSFIKKEAGAILAILI